jgi:uncharacterized protein (TIGR00299 family) protein
MNERSAPAAAKAVAPEKDAARGGRRVAHFDATTGAAGDMILGALIDAGAPLDEIRAALSTLPLPAFRIEATEVRHRGFRALRLAVDAPDETDHRHLPDVKKVLAAGELPRPVLAAAVRVFERLAEAEARSHGIPLEKVHFHEVGAADAILDIAGSALALHLLGVDDVTFSPLALGTGEVATAHGLIPVPVPAVLELTRGVPTVRTDVPFELLTPTGAAILTTLGRPAADVPIVAERVGVSCGSRELPDRPNLLRVTLGTSARSAGPNDRIPWEADEVVVLETNLDDMSPEILPAVLEDLLAAGALDAFLTPVLMKKGRPGHLLTVLVEESAAEKIAALLFRETTTFGLRRSKQPRWKLARESREIETPWGPLRVKVGDLGGGRKRVTPEFESCRAIADRTGRPLLEVYRAVEEHIRSIEWDRPGGAE